MDPSNPIFPQIVWQKNDVSSREELEYNQARLESSEIEINKLIKYYVKTKEKALNMKKLDNAVTNETNIAAEENELRKEVQRLWKVIENDQACSEFLLKHSRKMEDIFAEMRILIAAKQTEKFVTTYKSYKEEYDRLHIVGQAGSHGPRHLRRPHRRPRSDHPLLEGRPGRPRRAPVRGVVPAIEIGTPQTCPATSCDEWRTRPRQRPPNRCFAASVRGM